MTWHHRWPWHDHDITEVYELNMYDTSSSARKCHSAQLLRDVHLHLHQVRVKSSQVPGQVNNREELKPSQVSLVKSHECVNREIQ